MVSKLYPSASLDLGPTSMVAGEALSTQALREMAEGTKGIALIAASRRSKAQDRDGGSGRSSLHLPEDAALDSRDSSPSDRRWRHASPSRDRSLERRARKKRSPSLTRGTVGARAPSMDIAAERGFRDTGQYSSMVLKSDTQRTEKPRHFLPQHLLSDPSWSEGPGTGVPVTPRDSVRRCGDVSP